MRYLTSLTRLTLLSGGLTGDLQVLDNLLELRQFGFDSLLECADFTVLTELPQLRYLMAYGEHVPPAAVLRRLPRLTALWLWASSLDLSLDELVHTCSNLTTLHLYDCPWIDDLTPLATFPLQELALTGTPVGDLAPLAAHPTLFFLMLQNCPNVCSLDPLAGKPALATLWLNGCQKLGDLSPLGTLPSLRELHLEGARPGLDLSPLAGKKVTITLHEGQDVRGLDALGRRPRVVWTTPPATG